MHALTLCVHFLRSKYRVGDTAIVDGNHRGGAYARAVDVDGYRQLLITVFRDTFVAKCLQVVMHRDYTLQAPGHSTGSFDWLTLRFDRSRAC